MHDSSPHWVRWGMVSNDLLVWWGTSNSHISCQASQHQVVSTVSPSLITPFIDDETLKRQTDKTVKYFEIKLQQGCYKMDTSSTNMSRVLFWCGRKCQYKSTWTVWTPKQWCSHKCLIQTKRNKFPVWHQFYHLVIFWGQNWNKIYNILINPSCAGPVHIQGLSWMITVPTDALAHMWWHATMRHSVYY